MLNCIFGKRFRQQHAQKRVWHDIVAAELLTEMESNDAVINRPITSLGFIGYWHGPSNPYNVWAPEPTKHEQERVDLLILRDTIAAELLTEMESNDAVINRPITSHGFIGYWHGPNNPYNNVQVPEPEPEPASVIETRTNPDYNQYRIMTRCIRIKWELLEAYAIKTMAPVYLQPLLDNPELVVDDFMEAYVNGL